MRLPALMITLVLAALAAACGGTVDDDSGGSAAAPPRQGLFLARPAGPAGPITAYDARSLGRRFQLPAGVTSADRSAHFALRGALLQRFDPITGVLRRTSRV